MFVELFLQELSASIARAAPIVKASPDRKLKAPPARPARDKEKVDRRRKGVVLPDQLLGSLAEEVERLLGFFKPHQVAVLRARLGVDGRRTTLEEAARRAEITRERARQLETRFVSYFLGTPAAQSLMDRIARLRTADGEPLFLRDLASKDPWFGGLAAESEVVLPLLGASSGSDLHFLTTPAGAVVAPRSIMSWEELLNAVMKKVAQVRPGTNRHVVRKTVAGVLKKREAPELLSILMPIVESKTQYSSSERLIAFGGYGAAAVEAILEDSDRPLHYSEVAHRWSERAGRPITAYSAHAALERSPNVYLLGRGTHGLAIHIGLTPVAIRRLIADCESIVTKVAPKKQWHTRELLEALQMVGRAPEKADKYVINACLSRSSVLESVGRLVWVVRRARPRTTADRIDLRDAAVQALERAGRPLRDDELRREIERSRGIGEYHLIVATERMARTAPATWGLLDRDFVLTEAQREAVSDAIYNAVVTRGVALHTSEVPEALATISIPEGATPYMIRQLAGRDPRLKLFKGDFIGLHEWENPRRPSWREAMAQIASSLDAPVTLDWIQAELQRRVRRSLSRVALYNLVSASGLTVNRGQTRGPQRRTTSDDGSSTVPSKPA